MGLNVLSMWGCIWCGCLCCLSLSCVVCGLCLYFIVILISYNELSSQDLICCSVFIPYSLRGTLGVLEMGWSSWH